MTNRRHTKDQASNDSQPVFIQLTPDLHGAVVNGPRGSFLVSYFHEPTGRTGFGIEDAHDRALSWLEAAKLIFQDTEGAA